MAIARLLLLFLLATLGGWALRRPFTASASSSSSPASAASKTEHDLKQQQFKAQAALLQREVEGGFSSHRAELHTWTTAALRSALEDGLHDPGIALPESPETKAVLALLGEWTSRDPQGAAAWWLDLKPAPLQAILSGAIADGWPADRAEEGLEFFLSHRDSFLCPLGYRYGSLVQKACEAAAARGPEAVEAVLSLIRENHLVEPQQVLSFPKNFDFAAWARSPEMAKRLDDVNNPLTESFVFGTWMDHDPEGAMDFIIADNRQRGRDLANGLFNAIYPFPYRMDPAEVVERARRIAAHSLGLPVEEQREIMRRAGERLAPEILKAFAGTVPDSGLRSEAYLAAAKGRIEQNIPLALELLSEASGSTEGRIGMLEELIASRPLGSSNSLYRKTETQVRETLAGWKVPADRIDSLVTEMKKVPW